MSGFLLKSFKIWILRQNQLTTSLSELKILFWCMYMSFLYYSPKIQHLKVRFNLSKSSLTVHTSATNFVKCTFVERHQQQLTLVLHQQLQHQLKPDWDMNQQSSDCHFTNLTASLESFSSHSLKPSQPLRHSINPRYSSLTLPDDSLSVKWMLTETY